MLGAALGGYGTLLFWGADRINFQDISYWSIFATSSGKHLRVFGELLLGLRSSAAIASVSCTFFVQTVDTVPLEHGLNGSRRSPVPLSIDLGQGVI